MGIVMPVLVTVRGLSTLHVTEGVKPAARAVPAVPNTMARGTIKESNFLTIVEYP